jgi:hypothetical protein
MGRVMRSATVLAILGTGATAQAETLEAHTLTSTTKVALDVESTGRFQKLTVRLSNRTKVRAHGQGLPRYLL